MSEITTGQAFDRGRRTFFFTSQGSGYLLVERLGVVKRPLYAVEQAEAGWVARGVGVGVSRRRVSRPTLDGLLNAIA